MSTASASNDVDDIRRQMAAIRHELHEDVRDVVASAEAVADWRRYLAAYPWLTLGGAFAVGYFLVPRRRKAVEEVLADVKVATQADLSKVRQAVDSAREAAVAAVKSGAVADEPERKRKKGLIGAAIGLAVPVALRAAQGYALKYLEQWIAQQQVLAMNAGPPPFAGAAAGPSGGPNPGHARGPSAGPNPGQGPRTRPDGGPSLF